MHFVGTVTQLAGKRDDLGNDELGHTPRVRKGRVEDGNTMVGGVLQVYLVGANAKAADNQQVLRMFQHILRQLGL